MWRFANKYKQIITLTPCILLLIVSLQKLLGHYVVGDRITPFDM